MASSYTTQGTKRPLDTPTEYQTKRVRTSEPEQRIVYVTGLPEDCSESELLALCCPFAVVEKTQLVPEQRHAFVQLPDAASATALLSFYDTRETTIRGNRIVFTLSSREDLLTDTTPAPLTAPPQQQPPAQQYSQNTSVAQPHDDRSNGLNRQPPVYASEPPRPMPPLVPDPYVRPESHPTGPINNAILMVSVSKIQYDVTVDVLHQVFQKFGNVMKIVTFWKNDEFKALIQMETREQAQAAQAALNNREIYTGCNQLNIVFSRHPDLQVRFNNDRCRDFTNPNLPSGEAASQPTSNLNHSAPFDHRERQRDRYPEDPYPRGRDPYAYGREDYNRSTMPDDRDRRRDMVRQPMPALPLHSTGRSRRSDTNGSSVLICSNMDRQLVNPNRVFTFFGCFGDVARVKIMFRKQDTALIQFVDEVHATSALNHLDAITVFGKKLRVDYSKHSSITLPRGEVDLFEKENTRDFSNSPLHRYRKRSPSEAVSPCPLLHISGIPLELQRNQTTLIDLFARYGTVKHFHFIQKNTKMALLEMSTLDEAILALLELDNLSYPDSHMRVSFSKAYQIIQAEEAAAAAYGGRRDRDRLMDRDRGRPMFRDDREPLRDFGGHVGHVRRDRSSSRDFGGRR